MMIEYTDTIENHFSITAGANAMLRVAFAGTFTATLEEPVRRYLTTPCQILVASEADIIEKLPEIDVLVTMGLDDLALLGGPDILDEVLERSDYVVVSMPSSPETIGWIGEPELRRMKQSAYLINVGRGQIVDEHALYDALARRSIAGAALDVWYRYPREPGPAAPATRPFHELPNVLMTPHVSGYTDGTLNARARLIAENIRRIATGEKPLNLVN